MASCRDGMLSLLSLELWFDNYAVAATFIVEINFIFYRDRIVKGPLFARRRSLVEITIQNHLPHTNTHSSSEGHKKDIGLWLNSKNNIKKERANHES